METTDNGLIVILGNTRGTLERNIFDPMRNIWGETLIGTISSNNTINLFGKKVYALGADKKNQVEKIQGAGIEYCYGDEITTWNEEVFNMLKSRLDKPTSVFDGTCNPASPNHWLKTFLDSDADIFHQHYTIDDNPFLDEAFVRNLKKEYAGTVYYKRYILGQWALAEGAIYSMFTSKHKIAKRDWEATDEHGRHTHPIRSKGGYINVGVDFGGNKSAHAFVANWISDDDMEVVTVKDFNTKKHVTPNELDDLFVDFIKEVLDEGYIINRIYADSAEQVLIRGLNKALEKAQLWYTVVDSKKIAINERIRFYQRMINSYRYYALDSCKHTIEALENAVWSDKTDGNNKDIRLDDGTTNIDNLDALEYTTERIQKRLLREE